MASSVKGNGIVQNVEMLGINQTPDWRAFTLSATVTPTTAIPTAISNALGLINEVRYVCMLSDFLVAHSPDAPADQWVTWPKERILVIPLNDCASKVYIKTASGVANVQCFAFGFLPPSQS